MSFSLFAKFLVFRKLKLKSNLKQKFMPLNLKITINPQKKIIKKNKKLLNQKDREISNNRR